MPASSVDILRILLAATLAGLFVLAAFYLRTRRLTLSGYIAWGLLALLVPVVGPFLVIALHPGQPAGTKPAPRREPREMQAYALNMELQVREKERE